MILVDKEAMLKQLKPITSEDEESAMLIADAKHMISNFIRSAKEVPTDMISDGYHTFADLYAQRLFLSAALAKNNLKAWKSKYHEDGSEPFGGGWFVVGFDTDKGPYTYHYKIEDWDMFECQELNKAKPYDGHTSKDVYRLLYL